jgi:hypothetical protein
MSNMPAGIPTVDRSGKRKQMSLSIMEKWNNDVYRERHLSKRQCIEYGIG